MTYVKPLSGCAIPANCLDCAVTKMQQVLRDLYLMRLDATSRFFCQRAAGGSSLLTIWWRGLSLEPSRKHTTVWIGQALPLM